MSINPPPNPNVNTFNNLYFISEPSAGLTQEQLDTMYLKFPISQSQKETISGDMDVLGLLSTTNIINSDSLETDDLTVNGTFSINTVDIDNLTVNNTSNLTGVATFNSALVISNGNQNTSLGNGFLPLAVGQGTQNVFVGVGAGLSALCGGGNTVCGYFSASQGMNATASFNTLYGERAGQYLTSGVGNTLIGATNCNNITTGNSNICLGYGAMAGEPSGSLSNNIVIGNGIQSGASNRIILGDGSQTSMDLKVVSGSTVNMGGKLVMNDATIANRHITSALYSFQGYTTGITSGEIKIQGSDMDITSVMNGGNVNFLINDGLGNQAYRFRVSSTQTSCPEPFYMTGTTDVKRLINGCYYQIADNISPFNTNKQMYSNGTNVVFDNDTQGGAYTFATEAVGGGQSIPLTISSTSLTSQCVQPAYSDTSSKIPTTAWVQGAIGLKQKFNYQVFNSTSTIPASTSVQLITPYINTPNFSWVVRLQVDYSLYANYSPTTAVDPKTLNIIPTFAGSLTNVNPNTTAIIDLVFATSARTTVIQSASTAITTPQSYSPNNINASYSYTPFSISTVNQSPTTSQSTITLTIGFPAVPYTTGLNYKGNITTASVSIKILSSMESTTSTPTKSSSSTGIAYFV